MIIICKSFLELIEADFFELLVEEYFKLFGSFADLMLLAVVLDTVVPNEVHVIDKVLEIFVAIM